MTEEEKAAQAAAEAEAAKKKEEEGLSPEELEAKRAAEKEKKKPVVKDVPDDLSLEPDPVTIAPTGNKEVDAISKLLETKKVAGADKIIAEFAETGEISIANQAILTDALGESVAGLAIRQLESVATNLREQGKEARKNLMEYAAKTFNAEDADLTWKQIQEFVRTPEAGFSKDDLAAMNKMIAKGGMQAELVIDKIASVYYAQETSSTPAELLQGDTYSAGSFEPLSRVDYVEQMREAVRKYGENSHQVEQLNRRRMISRQRGF